MCVSLHGACCLARCLCSAQALTPGQAGCQAGAAMLIVWIVLARVSLMLVL